MSKWQVVNAVPAETYIVHGCTYLPINILDYPLFIAWQTNSFNFTSVADFLSVYVSIYVLSCWFFISNINSHCWNKQS